MGLIIDESPEISQRVGRCGDNHYSVTNFTENDCKFRA